MSLETPIIFILFNRPELTAKVFSTIRTAQPKKLLVVADGPRPNHPSDAERCSQTRSVVMDNIDWPCDVLTNFSDNNLGCGKRVSSGITWAFEQVEEAIILEDDCLPDPSFFIFCQQMLEYYRDNPKIMHIGGANPWNVNLGNNESYLFTRYPMIWGWATWRRAWRHYNYKLTTWPIFKDRELLSSLFRTRREYRFWHNIFQLCYDGKFESTWDYMWTYTIFEQGGLTILSSSNLISNIGFGIDATHTQTITDEANAPLNTISKIIHPPAIFVPSQKSEQQLAKRIMNCSISNRIIHTLYRLYTFIGRPCAPFLKNLAIKLKGLKTNKSI